VNYCPLLQKLTLRHDDGWYPNFFTISDRAFIYMTEHSTHLEEIHLIKCDLLTDLSMDALRDNSRNLKAITIFKSGRITPEGVSSLVTGCTQLQSINIDYPPPHPLGTSTLITDRSLGDIASNCPLLTTLVLHDSRDISAVGYRAFTAHSRHITGLYINKSSTLTEDIFMSFAQHFPDLVNLHVCECMNISPAIIERIKLEYPLIQHVSAGGFYRPEHYREWYQWIGGGGLHP
jgi:hypothetical protein